MTISMRQEIGKAKSDRRPRQVDISSASLANSMPDAVEIPALDIFRCTIR